MIATDLVEVHTPFGDIAARRRRLLGAGFAMVLLGLAAPAFPAATSFAVGVIAGWLLWLAGAVSLGYSLLLAPGRLRIISMLTSMFIIAAGMLLTFRPALGALATALILGCVFILEGSLQAALALKLRPLAAWRWMLGSAFASLAAAALLSTGEPEQSSLEVGMLLGLAFITTGAGLLAVGFSRPR